MGYTLYDINGKEILHGDVENRTEWYSHGERKEIFFIKQYGEKLNIIINPEKVSRPYAIDMIHTVTNKFVDLKTENTPHFTTGVKYKIDPQFAITLNRKDVERYSEICPDMILYFWVDWKAITFISDNTRFDPIQVRPMTGVWSITLKEIIRLIEQGIAPLHEYNKRKNDSRRNAKDSYIFDIRNPHFKQLI